MILRRFIPIFHMVEKYYRERRNKTLTFSSTLQSMSTDLPSPLASSSYFLLNEITFKSLSSLSL